MSDALDAAYAGLVDDLTRGATRCPGCGETPVRVGTDVQAVAAVSDALARHGERYLERVYTRREVDDARAGASDWSEGALASLTARFAVKEAVVKAMRQVPSGVRWAEVETVREPGGWPTIALHGRAADDASAAGLGSWVAAFSHDGGVAVATVICRHECRAARPAAPTTLGENDGRRHP